VYFSQRGILLIKHSIFNYLFVGVDHVANMKLLKDMLAMFANVLFSLFSV
jgi:hypothetical protein